MSTDAQQLLDHITEVVSGAIARHDARKAALRIHEASYKALLHELARTRHGEASELSDTEARMLAGYAMRADVAAWEYITESDERDEIPALLADVLTALPGQQMAECAQRLTDALVRNATAYARDAHATALHGAWCGTWED